MEKFNDFCLRRNTKCRFGNETEGQLGSVKKTKQKKQQKQKQKQTKQKHKESW